MPCAAFCVVVTRDRVNSCRLDDANKPWFGPKWQRGAIEVGFGPGIQTKCETNLKD